VKNLALTGVGKISISEFGREKILSIAGGFASLVEYAKDLNPTIKVYSVLDSHKYI